MLENVFSFGGFNEHRARLQFTMRYIRCMNYARKITRLARYEKLMTYRANRAAYRLGYITLDPQTDLKSPRIHTTPKPAYISRGQCNVKTSIRRIKL